MRDYEIEGEFSDQAAESGVLATLAQGPTWVHAWRSKIERDFFFHHAADWDASQPTTGLPFPDEATFLDALERLAQLERKRRVARLQRTAWESLFAPGETWDKALGVLESGVRQLREPLPAAPAQTGADLASAVIADADRKRQKRRETGKPVMGIPSGFNRLDQMINGWYAGLHVLAAGPGVGKTTLCLQFAWEALRQGHPVLYVSYENAPRNLMLKLLCARAAISSAEVERGYGDVEKLEQAQEEGRAFWPRLRIIEGDGRLRMAAVEQTMAALLAEHSAPEGLIVFDYLQRGAHGMGYDQLRQNVSLLTGELRESAMRLNCPVIAISSQNRSAGDYGRGGSGALDSLKESGDLEYGADTVALLYQPAEVQQPPPPARELELKVAKNRFGAVGSFRVIFRPDTGVFREKA